MKAKTFQVLASFLFALALPHSAMADYGALALASDGSHGWATRATQKEAERAALKFCNDNTPKKDCALTHLKAIAQASRPDFSVYDFNFKGAADARRKALATCGATCKVEVITAPGFWSYALSEKDAKGKTYGALQYGDSDSDNANKLAVQACERKSGMTCKGEKWGVIPGRIGGTRAPSAPTGLTATAENCRPRTDHVRCESQCANGACLITYENGCRMRVQVQSRFDPVTKQWVYPSPRC